MPENQTRKADGTTAVPTEPNPTQVTTADENGLSKDMMKNSKTINKSDVTFEENGNSHQTKTK